MAVQHHFRTQYGCQPPIWKSTRFWDNKLRTTDRMLHVKSPGKTSEVNVNHIREAFQRSLHKSIHAASLQLQIPCSTVHDVLHKRLCLRAHFCYHVWNHIDREMAGRWIGRGGPIAWPPGSPDLTPLDFFLCGYVENIVSQVRINDLQHLKACVRKTLAMELREFPFVMV
jgi:hypothetical protein